jgi:hypothetical protein
MAMISKKYVGIGIGTILFLFVVSSMLISASLQSKQSARAATGSPPTKSPTCAWTAISSPNVGTKSILRKIDALKTDDIWAVGSGSDDKTGHAITLTERWNGSMWNVIASPNNGSYGSSFTNVVATGKSNAFAIGNSYDQAGNSQTLIEHWNGAVWSIMPSPNRDSNGVLVGITALSQNNIWTAGSYFNSNLKHNQSLIEHWNGVQWNIINSPNINDTDNTLSDIHAVASNDVWAVGYTGPDVVFTEHSALIEHWDGHKWSIVSHPASQLNGSLTAISTISAKNIWVVGQYLPASNNATFQTLAEHWDGTQWSIVPTSDVAGYNDFFADIKAISPTNIWAVGASQSNNYQSSQTLIEHWNGTKWNIVSSPNPDAGNNVLSAITRIPGTTSLWVVGNTGRGTLTKTLTESIC